MVLRERTQIVVKKHAASTGDLSNGKNNVSSNGEVTGNVSASVKNKYASKSEANTGNGKNISNGTNADTSVKEKDASEIKENTGTLQNIGNEQKEMDEIPGDIDLSDMGDIGLSDTTLGAVAFPYLNDDDVTQMVTALVNKVENTVATKLNAMETNCVTLDAKLNAVENNCVKLDTKLDSMEINCVQLGTRLDCLEKKLDNTNQSQNHLSARLVAAEQERHNMRTHFDVQLFKINKTVDVRMDNMEKNSGHKNAQHGKVND